MSETYDAVVIGAGPAGCSAALYAARASLSVLMVERGMPGGQITTTDVVENYPGFLSITGAEIGSRMQEQAEAAGVAMAYGEVDALAKGRDGLFELSLGGAAVAARSVVAATGARPRKAGFAGEERLAGRGISYCATCDGMFFRNKRVFVVGGGNSACEEALYLSRIAATVELVVRRDAFRAPKGMVDRLLSQPNIKVRYLTSIVAVEGERFVGAITFQDNATGAVARETFEEGSVGIFVFTGHDPETRLVEDLVELGPDGGVLTGEDMETATPGLFCAGDIRSKSLRQVVTAAADGAIAGSAAYRYVEERFRT